MSDHYPRLRLMTADGYLLVREGLSLCFYMRPPHEELAPAILEALQVYLRAVGTQALGRAATLDGEWRELDESGWADTRKELSSGESPIVLLHDSEDASYRYRFEYYGKSHATAFVRDRPDAVCSLRLWLPSEYLQEHGPGRVRELSLELARVLPIISGHVGLAFNGELDITGMGQHIREHCFRFPGLDLLPLEHVSWEIGTRIRGPAWLTFLGQPALNGLGGISSLRNQLHAPGTTVESLPGGRAVITLGDWPEAGDTEQGRTLPAYRELARVLEPWLFREVHPNAMNLGFTPEDLLRWERRFLD